MGAHYNSFYDNKAILRYLVWLIILVGLSLLTKGAVFGAIVVIMMMYMAMGKNELLLFVILITTCFMLMNGNLVPKSFVFHVSAKVLLMMAASVLSLRIFGRQSSPVMTPLLAIFPYLIFMVFSSQKGWCPIISNMKLLLFTMIFFAYYGCAVCVLQNEANNRTLRSMVLSIAILIIFGSVALLPFPGIAYMSNIDPLTGNISLPLFAGMCNHSQMLGPVVCVFGVLIYADLLFFLQYPDKLYISLLLCCPLLLYMTSSRTALASFVAGVGFATFWAMRTRSMKKMWQRKIVNFMLGMIILISSSVLFIPQLREKALRFAVKYDMNEKVNTSSESIWKSREGKLASALDNWHRSPYIGNGFQVSEDMAGRRVNGIRDVLTAPVEKSTWTYAILEEGGVIGMGLFILFLLVVFGTLIARKAYIGLSIFFTFVLSNMGEFTIFSMSADGGLFWFLVFFGLVLDHKRLYGRHMPALGQMPLPPPQFRPC